MIPKYILENICENKDLINFCEYFMDENCPESCGYALDIFGKHNITLQKAKSGLQRFIERYGEDWREMFI